MVGNMYRICCFNVVGVFAFCFASSGTAEERVMEEATGGGGNQTAYEKENTPPIRARRDRAQQSLAVKAFVEKFTVIPQGGKMALEMSSTRMAFDSRSPETIITCLRSRMTRSSVSMPVLSVQSTLKTSRFPKYCQDMLWTIAIIRRGSNLASRRLGRERAQD